MSKICLTTSLKKDAISLMEESLMDIDIIRKLNKFKPGNSFPKLNKKNWIQFKNRILPQMETNLFKLKHGTNLLTSQIKNI